MQFFTTLVTVVLAGAVAAAPVANTEAKRDCTCSQGDYHTQFFNCMLPYWEGGDLSAEAGCANTVVANCGDCGVLYMN